MALPVRVLTFRSPLEIVLALATFAVASCSPSRPESGGEQNGIGLAQSAILGGKPSGDDENAVVYIETTSTTTTLRCTGRLIAPGLVITARHCLLKRKSIDVQCNPDGSPKQISDTTDVRPEPPEQITVFIGSRKPDLKPIAVREVITNIAVTICISDVGFLVLREPGITDNAIRSPLRVAPLRIGDEVSVTGWGYTSDARDALPLERSTIEHLRVSDVGPGLIPNGTFATGGNSVCLGDSGASAMINGAVAGTYSRITGDVAVCSLQNIENVFASVATELDLAKQAFAAIGEQPWIEGERPPWLASAGAPCTKNEDCRSAVCTSTSTCAEPCGGVTKMACASDQECSANAECVPRTPPAADGGTTGAPPDESSCATHVSSRSERSTNSVATIATLLVLFVCRRARRLGSTAARR